MRFPVETLCNISKYMDQETLLKYITTFPDSELSDVFDYEIRKRWKAYFTRRNFLVDLTELSILELCILCEMYKIFIQNRRDGMYTIELVNTYINTNNFKISNSKRFGVNKWYILLYCKVDIGKMERVIQSSRMYGKCVEFCSHTTVRPSLYEDNRLMFEKVYVFKTDYESIFEEFNREKDRDVVLCSYTFLV